jgi:hypothetical protein
LLREVGVKMVHDVQKLFESIEHKKQKMKWRRRRIIYYLRTLKVPKGNDD